MRAEGHALESICRVLPEQGCQVAREPTGCGVQPVAALLSVNDAFVQDAVRAAAWAAGVNGVRVLAPEGLYGRRKMTAHLRPTSAPVASRGAVDRAMRAMGLAAVRRDKHDAPGQGRHPRLGPGQPAVHRTCTEPDLGYGLHPISFGRRTDGANDPLRGEPVVESDISKLTETARQGCSRKDGRNTPRSCAPRRPRARSAFAAHDLIQSVVASRRVEVARRTRDDNAVRSAKGVTSARYWPEPTRTCRPRRTASHDFRAGWPQLRRAVHCSRG